MLQSSSCGTCATPMVVAAAAGPAAAARRGLLQLQLLQLHAVGARMLTSSASCAVAR